MTEATEQVHFPHGQFNMEGLTLKPVTGSAEPVEVTAGDFVAVTGHPDFLDTDIMKVFSGEAGLSIMDADGAINPLIVLNEEPSAIISKVVNEGDDVTTKAVKEPSLKSMLTPYQITSIRHAALIDNVERRNPTSSGVLRFAHPDQPAIEVSAEYLDKHKPQAGGYYVVYRLGQPDEYRSYCPAEQFEEDHEAI